MAIFTSVVLLAQNASSTINENLQVSEENLKNANQELDLLKEQYNNMLTQAPETTFFNFSNMYFWFVLVGLLLLAFGLLFLLAELQNKDKSIRQRRTRLWRGKSKVASIKEEKEEEIAEEKVEEEPELAEEAEEEKIEEEEELVEEDEDESAKGGPASPRVRASGSRTGGDEEEEKSIKKIDKPIKIKVEKIK